MGDRVVRVGGRVRGRLVHALVLLGASASSVACAPSRASDDRAPDVSGAGAASGAIVTTVDTVASGAVTSSGAGGAGDGVLGPLPAQLFVTGDTDRDGEVDADDLEGRSTFTWERGAFALANVDDDDGDGVPDAEDATSGAADLDDLARLRIELGSQVTLAAASLSVAPVSGGAHVRLFRFASGGVLPVASTLPVAPVLDLGVEAKRFASGDWNGKLRFVVTARDANGEEVATDEVALRVAPLLLVPSSAPAAAVHVASGAFANQAFLDELSAACAQAGTGAAPPFLTTKTQEMWMQDHVELGVTQLPGRPPMRVALRANLGFEAFPKKLLGPGTGYVAVGSPRGLAASDAWLDGHGNLEVSPPVPGWPLGRVYYGLDTASGLALHPEVVALLEAQEVQSPFWVDTSFLARKQVDALMTFVLDGAQKPRLLVASPREAGKLYPAVYGPYSKGLQAKIDTALQGGTYLIAGKSVAHPGVLALLGLAAADVVELPVYFTAGAPDWSNPVNGSFLAGATYAAGDAKLGSPERKAIVDKLGGLGLTVAWVDDAPYHANVGNLHSATNATRTPVVTDFSKALPALP